MSYQLRQLREDEWGRVENHPAFGATPPKDAIILIGEDEQGEIIACWSLVAVPHMEGFWIHPQHRMKSTLPVRMINKMKALLASYRIPQAFCWTDTPKNAEYLTRLGFKPMKFDTFLFEVE